MEGDSIASECGNRSGVVENENDWGLGDAVLEDLAVEIHAASACGAPPPGAHLRDFRWEKNLFFLVPTEPSNAP